jgi:hypothetical protein
VLPSSNLEIRNMHTVANDVVYNGRRNELKNEATHAWLIERINV